MIKKMKRLAKIINMVFLVSILPVASFALSGISFRTYKFRDKNYIEIVNTIRNADMLVDYTNDGMIKTGELKKSDRHSSIIPELNIYEERAFSFDDLRSFFEGQDKKDLIIIVLDKIKDEIGYGLKDELMTLHEYFSSVGYKQIVIVQGISKGIIVFFDEINESP